MDLIDFDLDEDEEAAKLTDEERLARFKAAVQVGLDDLAAGRSRTFHDLESLAAYFDEIIEQAIKRA